MSVSQYAARKRSGFFIPPLTAIAGLLLVILLGFSSLLLAQPAKDRRHQFTVFDAPNATYTHASNINDRGVVTGYLIEADRRVRAFIRDEKGKLTVFDAIAGGTDTEPAGTNVHGDTAGTAQGGAFSFVRDKRGNITTFTAPNALETFASGINARGDISGMFKDPVAVANHGYARDKRGNIATFDFPNGSNLQVTGPNDRREIAGTFEDWNEGGKQRVYVRRWQGQLEVFDISNGTPWLVGINNRGEIAGIYVDQGQVSGFVRDPGGHITVLDVPTPWVNGFNIRGEVVGSFGDPDRGGKTCGFVWEPDGSFTVLDVPNASATYAYSINARGEVSGSFDDARQSGKRRGFIFKPRR